MTDEKDHAKAPDGSPAHAVEEPVDSHEELVDADDAVIGRAFRTSLLVLVGILVVAGAAFFIARQPEAAPPEVTPELAPAIGSDTAIETPELHFTDVTASWGIDFVHENGARGEKLLPESMGSGVAVWDYDNDGDQDLVFVNGAPWPADRDPSIPPVTMALFRNEGAGRFIDVTEGSGLDVEFYGTGVAVGDYDGDGWSDLFVSALGKDRLFRNVGGERFEDVTESAAVGGGDQSWSTSAGFADFDGDEDLDLFVCTYVQWSRDIDFAVDYRLVGIGRAYGPPMNFKGTHSSLYRNNGDGTFTDVAAEAGLHVENPATGLPIGKALGVAVTDIDGDGFPDILVANDTVQNFLFHNRGDGTFEEIGERSGLAYDRSGAATGAMGIDGGFYRNDDTLGFFIGNFSNEMTSVYASQEDALTYNDVAITEGVGAASRLMLSFGLFLFDVDLDGRLDLFQANGHLEEEINVVQPSQHYEQPAQIFWNAGPQSRSCFIAIDPQECGDLGTPVVGRAAAYGDLDDDGDLDIVMTQVGRTPMVLRNDLPRSDHWVRFKLVGKAPNRDAIGAIVTLATETDVQRRMVMPTRSYLAQVELPVTFGFPKGAVIDEVNVLWPDGHKQTVKSPKAGREHEIRYED